MNFTNVRVQLTFHVLWYFITTTLTLICFYWSKVFQGRELGGTSHHDLFSCANWIKGNCSKLYGTTENCSILSFPTLSLFINALIVRDSTWSGWTLCVNFFEKKSSILKHLTIIFSLKNKKWDFPNGGIILNKKFNGPQNCLNSNIII